MPSRSRGRDAGQIERDALIFAMRRAGNTYSVIAETVGVSTKTVRKSLERAITSLGDENVQHMRGIENARYDWLERQLVEIITGSHPLVSTSGKLMIHPDTGEIMLDPKPRTDAASQLLRVWDRRAKLNGLDKPARLNITHDSLDADIERIMEELARRGEEAAPGTAPDGAIQNGRKALEGPRTAEAAAAGRPEASRSGPERVPVRVQPDG
jgi:predicted transcriptional regulator